MSSNKSNTVLITGCSRGIGLGLVKEYLRQGFQVVATCRTPEIAMALADVLKKHHQRPPIKLDVGSLNSIQDCQKEIMNNHESIDVLVNNAAISNKEHPDDPACSVDLKEFQEVMKINVTGVLALTQAFIPLLRKSSNNPRVINISSEVGSISSSSRFSSTSYQTSKAALNMLTKCFANDAKSKNIVFVSMEPGWVRTALGGSKNRNPPLSIEESATGIIKVAHTVPIEKSGCFVGLDGREIPY